MNDTDQTIQQNAEGARAPRVLLGVTGGIAAYKGCEILRELQKAGGEVRVIMTESATHFVGPVTFEALSGHRVGLTLFDDPTDPIPHITAAKWCDLFLVAPCTANVMAKLANGLADDLLTSTALAVTAPMVIAPAMNDHMYANPATRQNLDTLLKRGVTIVEAGDGYLACGDAGPGRLAEVDDIVARVLSMLGGSDTASHGIEEGQASGRSKDLTGKTVLITAGPTQEPIDAVRYISNYSSGKMGFAIAEEALSRGASVVVVAGPVTLPAPQGVRLIPVQTARDMLAVVEQEFPRADVGIFAAAVADYRPAHQADRKLKKGEDDTELSNLELVKNPDILATAAASKKAGQVVVGFAAETDEVLANAQEKLRQKHADLIVANEVGKGKAFGTDDDKVWFVSESGVSEEPLMSKDAVASLLLDRVAALLEK